MPGFQGTIIFQDIHPASCPFLKKIGSCLESPFSIFIHPDFADDPGCFGWLAHPPLFKFLPGIGFGIDGNGQAFAIFLDYCANVIQHSPIAPPFSNLLITLATLFPI